MCNSDTVNNITLFMGIIPIPTYIFSAHDQSQTGFILSHSHVNVISISIDSHVHLHDITDKMQLIMH